jgi:Rrf2 family protein
MRVPSRSKSAAARGEGRSREREPPFEEKLLIVDTFPMIMNNYGNRKGVSKMLRISTKARYGLRALVSLAQHQDSSNPVVLSEIAEEQGISEKYLEHIASMLRAAGIVTGKRGAGGGYQLAQRPEKITVLEIVEALEGPIEPVVCLSNPRSCSRSESCVTRALWARLQEAIRKELSSITLKDLIETCYVDFPTTGRGRTPRL